MAAVRQKSWWQCLCCCNFPYEHGIYDQNSSFKTYTFLIRNRVLHLVFINTIKRRSRLGVQSQVLRFLAHCGLSRHVKSKPLSSRFPVYESGAGLGSKRKANLETSPRGSSQTPIGTATVHWTGSEYQPRSVKKIITVGSWGWSGSGLSRSVNQINPFGFGPWAANIPLPVF